MMNSLPLTLYLVQFSRIPASFQRVLLSLARLMTRFGKENLWRSGIMCM